MPETIIVRRATIQDAGAIARLSGELGYPADADAMQERVRVIADSATNATNTHFPRTAATLSANQRFRGALVAESRPSRTFAPHPESRFRRGDPQRQTQRQAFSNPLAGDRGVFENDASGQKPAEHSRIEKLKRRFGTEGALRVI